MYVDYFSCSTPDSVAWGFSHELWSQTDLGLDPGFTIYYLCNLGEFLISLIFKFSL